MSIPFIEIVSGAAGVPTRPVTAVRPVTVTLRVFCAVRCPEWANCRELQRHPIRQDLASTLQVFHADAIQHPIRPQGHTRFRRT